MRKRTIHGRGRVAASLAVSMAVFGGTAAVTAGPAQSVPPAEDCAEAFPVADLAEGQLVDGLTVDRGTAPAPFTGEVIGVLEDGIAPGLDMIMAELDSTALADAGGVWSGMSGSPVYAADDRLIGAVAYGLSWGSSPVAGITPFEEMDRYLPSERPARRVEVGSADARAIADHTDVSRAQAAEGFSRLPMPTSFTGGLAVGERLEQSATQDPPNGRFRGYVEKHAVARHGSSAAADEPGDPSTMVAGGNLAATYAHGDLTAGGVGTVTSVCGDDVVGFGHPMMFLGETTLTMHSARALYVQPDSLGAPFKVANFDGPVGTITDDRMSGISGVFDQLPAFTDITSSLTYGSDGRDGTTHVSLPDANASMTFYQQLVNHDRVLDAFTGGSELQSWTIEGTDDGTPFSISHTDRFSSAQDIAFEVPWDVADAVYALSSMTDVVVDEVTVDGDIVGDHATWRLRKLQQRQQGEWVNLSRKTPARATAGDTLRVRAQLQSDAGSTTVPLAFAVPRKAAGARGSLLVEGGGSSWYWAGGANSVAQLKMDLAKMPRNDAVAAGLFLQRGRTKVERQVASDPLEMVVKGRRFAPVRVR